MSSVPTGSVKPLAHDPNAGSAGLAEHNGDAHSRLQFDRHEPVPKG